MCVIICIEDGKYPSKSTLEDAESMNSHGGSIAWLDKHGRKNYQKGIKAKQITKIINKQLKPKGIKTAIIHFRIASVGNVNKALCHPFEITSRVDLNLKGEHMKTDLLFHNGTWSEYAEEMLEFLGKHSKPMTIPYGEFSDSRVMAYLAKRMGAKKMAKLVTGWNKIAILTEHGIDRYGAGWVDFKGNKCSNDYFVPKTFDEWSWAKDDKSYTFAGYGVNDQDYLNDEEKKTVVQLKKEYELTDDDINQYLDYGYSVDDIAFVVDQEIKEMRDVNSKQVQDSMQQRIDEEDEYMQNFSRRREGYEY
jgi:hypothetical protein